LAALFTNPNIQVGDAPRMTAASQDDDARERMDATPDPAPPVLSAEMDAEAVRVAMAAMGSDEDRKILRLVMDGVSVNEIGTRLGVTGRWALKRISGVLWQARSHASLARCLGVVAEPVPPRLKSGGLPAPKTFPPARLVG
jgi:hypothetical protein